jgi:SAM-dependent methyltransferase/uncharacterized protein YbaR (Trm112 family)
MRPDIFNALQPKCLSCGQDIFIAVQAHVHAGHIIEGELRCRSCKASWPIIDGMPILLADVQGWLVQQAPVLLRRDDLSVLSENRLGDALGIGSTFDTERQYLSNYATDHWGVFAGGPESRALALLQRVSKDFEGPILDLGCSTGRISVELAQSGKTVVGIDLHAGMLRMAARVLQTGRARWPRRRLGTAFERIDVPVPLNTETVDFWVSDVTSLPFVAGQFGTIVSMNLIDCVPSAAEHIRHLAHLLRPGGRLLLATPYDWSPGASAPGDWLGGLGMDPVPAEQQLRDLLQSYFEIEHEEERVPWEVRLHDRCRVMYEDHLIVAKRRAAAIFEAGGQ